MRRTAGLLCLHRTAPDEPAVEGCLLSTELICNERRDEKWIFVSGMDRRLDIAAAERAGEMTVGPPSPRTPLSSVLYVHDDCQCRDEVLSVFEGIVTCAGAAGDASSRLIYALDRSDGGT